MEILRDKGYIWIKAEPYDDLNKLLRDAFQMVKDDPDSDIQLIMSYQTMCSAGKIIVTKTSDYAKHVAMLDLADDHELPGQHSSGYGALIGP
jgi:hypothetical protein